MSVFTKSPPLSHLEPDLNILIMSFQSCDLGLICTVSQNKSTDTDTGEHSKILFIIDNYYIYSDTLYLPHKTIYCYVDKFET